MGKTTQLSNNLEHGIHFTTLMWIDKRENTIKRFVCGGDIGIPSKGTHMVVKTRKSFGNGQFVHQLIWFCHKSQKVISEYFP